MTKSNGNTVIGSELAVLGEVRNGGNVEVRGAVHGILAGNHVVIAPGGQVIGELRAQTAEVHGLLKGRIRVRELIAISDGGSVQGDVHYGRLALAPGGDLLANVRNIPPHLAGDFEAVVRRGASVRLTASDLTAVDPDDTASSLNFQISNIDHGHIARRDAPDQPVTSFTQADINDGAIVFVHDGASLDLAGFDATVVDSAGNTSGAPRRVTVSVMET